MLRKTGGITIAISLISLPDLTMILAMSSALVATVLYVNVTVALLGKVFVEELEKTVGKTKLTVLAFVLSRNDDDKMSDNVLLISEACMLPFGTRLGDTGWM